ncbi:MAG: chemotaxis protein CheD, partial [Fimbriimonadales bacterium]
GTGVLGCIGLGSCVGTVLYDPQTHTAALAHVMLPEPHDNDWDALPGKYATTAVPALIREIGLTTSQAPRLRAILIGGGELFQNRSQTLRIGERNVETLQQLMRDYRISVVLEEVRGSTGRSFEFDLSTGIVRVRKVGQPLMEHALAQALGMRQRAA